MVRSTLALASPVPVGLHRLPGAKSAIGRPGTPITLLPWPSRLLVVEDQAVCLAARAAKLERLRAESERLRRPLSRNSGNSFDATVHRRPPGAATSRRGERTKVGRWEEMPPSTNPTDASRRRLRHDPVPFNSRREIRSTELRRRIAGRAIPQRSAPRPKSRGEHFGEAVGDPRRLAAVGKAITAR